MRANHNAAAAELLKQAIVLNPRCAEAHHNYGLALAKLGNTAEGIEELKAATRLKPDLMETWLTLAGLQQAAGQMRDAISTYDEYLKLADQRHVPATTVRRLQQELAAELKRETELERQNGALRPAASSAILQVPAQAAQLGQLDDYLTLMTADGVKRWSANRMPIRVFIAEADWLPQFKHWRDDILKVAFSDWQTASEGRVKFVYVSERKQADIECDFQATRSPGTLSNSVEAGEADMFTEADGVTLTRGKIRLITTPLSPILPLTDNRMRLMCLHEIGHALGLAGHTTNPDDIMFYSTTFKDEHRELSGRDARTIQRLYASH